MPKTVLLIDDEKDLLEVIGAFIEDLGYKIIKAASCKETLEILKSNEVDVIVLDYMMPDIDGVTCLKRIRADGIKSPVIMFTAYPERTSMQEVEGFNVVGFVPKSSSYGDTGPMLKISPDMASKMIDKTN